MYVAKYTDPHDWVVSYPGACMLHETTRPVEVLCRSEPRYPGDDMDTHTAIKDLTVACVTSVKNATDLELDLTQDTLPMLDHYAELVDSPRDEVVSLLAPMCGAYFGEVLRQHLDDGDWDCTPEEHRDWRLKFERCSLELNPIGVALEVLTGREAEGWGSHLQMAPADRAKVDRALSVFGDVREDDFDRFSVRFEGVEQAYRALLNKSAGMAPDP
jgi:hypothetical protein